MSLPKQTKRSDLINRFKELGWDGPHKGRGGKHNEFMAKGAHKVKIPNKHRQDIGRDLLGMILEEASITKERWLGKESNDGSHNERG